MNEISNLFQFIGGLGMFLYGMRLMSVGLQKTAGDKMKHMLAALTNNRVTAIFMGALITAIIQSSSATTVMVIGFVNAGIMELLQSVGVIMGANIGTTATAWIVSLGQLGDAFAFFKPSFLAPLLIGVGAFLVLFSKKKKKQNFGEVLVALGLLFAGLHWMSGSVKPYVSNPIFAHTFTTLGSNPVLGILAGAVVTALMQSSSAAIGVLQTLAMSGVVGTNAAIYICLGSNIGTCVTGLLSCIGASKNAKRAAFINLMFNVFGVVLFGVISTVVFKINTVFAVQYIDSVHISIFHTIFNISNTILMFPLANYLVTVSKKIIKVTPDELLTNVKDIDLDIQLDDRIFEAPSLAIEASTSEVINMAKLVRVNVIQSMKCIKSLNTDEIHTIVEREFAINKYEKKLTSYLVRINNLDLTVQQNKMVKNLLYTINDLERIGDHADNIAEMAETMLSSNIEFSEDGLADLNQMTEKVLYSLDNAIRTREFMDEDAFAKVVKYEDDVDNLETEIRDKHIIRLSKKKCDTESGVVYLDVISNLERISDHSLNIAEYSMSEIRSNK